MKFQEKNANETKFVVYGCFLQKIKLSEAFYAAIQPLV
jgi:hypothetical protein